jgi:hypothetical protein
MSIYLMINIKSFEIYFIQIKLYISFFLIFKNKKNLSFILALLLNLK